MDQAECHLILVAGWRVSCAFDMQPGSKSKAPCRVGTVYTNHQQTKQKKKKKKKTTRNRQKANKKQKKKKTLRNLSSDKKLRKRYKLNLRFWCSLNVHNFGPSEAFSVAKLEHRFGKSPPKCS